MLKEATRRYMHGTFPDQASKLSCLNSDSPQFMRSLQILTLLLQSSESVLCLVWTHIFTTRPFLTSPLLALISLPHNGRQTLLIVC